MSMLACIIQVVLAIRMTCVVPRTIVCYFCFDISIAFPTNVKSGTVMLAIHNGRKLIGVTWHH